MTSASGCRSWRAEDLLTPAARRRDASMPSSRDGGGIPGADAAGRIDRDDAGGNAIEDRFDVPPAPLDVLVLSFELDGRPLEPPAAGGQLARHAVERVDQRAELVAAFRARRDDRGGRRRSPGAAVASDLDRPRDALGEVEPHPGRADQNHQRQHQEEREIDAGERLLEHRSC